MGLVDVLVGTVGMSEAVRPVALQTPGVGDCTLDLLLAGSVPPNPTELLESHAMSAVLEQAQSAYDLVVIDTPSLAMVPDAYALLGRVDGVILVGWVGRSRIDAAQQLRQMLAASGAPLLGVIANAGKGARTGRYTSSTGLEAKPGGGITSTTTPIGTPANTAPDRSSNDILVAPISAHPSPPTHAAISVPVVSTVDE